MNPAILIRCPVPSCAAKVDQPCISIYVGAFGNAPFIHMERFERFAKAVERGRCCLCGDTPIRVRRCYMGHRHMVCDLCATAAKYHSNTTIEKCLENDADKAMVMLARELF